MSSYLTQKESLLSTPTTKKTNTTNKRSNNKSKTTAHKTKRRLHHDVGPRPPPSAPRHPAGRGSRQCHCCSAVDSTCPSGHQQKMAAPSTPQLPPPVCCALKSSDMSSPNTVPKASNVCSGVRWQFMPLALTGAAISKQDICMTRKGECR